LGGLLPDLAIYLIFVLVRIVASNVGAGLAMFRGLYKDNDLVFTDYNGLHSLM